MTHYEALGDDTLKKLESLTENEILFVINHCSHNLITKTMKSNITVDEKEKIIYAVSEMAINFVQITNMYNVSADELASKIQSFNKNHKAAIANNAKKALANKPNENPVSLYLLK